MKNQSGRKGATDETLWPIPLRLRGSGMRSRTCLIEWVRPPP